jgi:hypothetical protein
MQNFIPFAQYTYHDKNYSMSVYTITHGTACSEISSELYYLSIVQLTSASFSSPSLAARQSGVSPSPFLKLTSALKVDTKAYNRGSWGRPVGWEGGREGGREEERGREREREKEVLTSSFLPDHAGAPSLPPLTAK